ncbi:hypothetical protein E2562_037929, partial [Oryza meyeriana var. granulata]
NFPDTSSPARAWQPVGERAGQEASSCEAVVARRELGEGSGGAKPNRLWRWRGCGSSSLSAVKLLVDFHDATAAADGGGAHQQLDLPFNSVQFPASH